MSLSVASAPAGSSAEPAPKTSLGPAPPIAAGGRAAGGRAAVWAGGGGGGGGAAAGAGAGAAAGGGAAATRGGGGGAVGAGAGGGGGGAAAAGAGGGGGTIGVGAAGAGAGTAAIDGAGAAGFGGSSLAGAGRAVAGRACEVGTGGRSEIRCELRPLSMAGRVGAGPSESSTPRSTVTLAPPPPITTWAEASAPARISPVSAKPRQRALRVSAIARPNQPLVAQRSGYPIARYGNNDLGRGSQTLWRRSPSGRWSWSLAARTLPDDIMPLPPSISVT